MAGVIDRVASGGVPAEPDGAPRLAVLDILRGLAILGILFMNINDMGGPFMGDVLGDPRLLGWTVADQVAWWLRQVLADGTARCLLEMLFGVGMVILTERFAAELNGWAVLRRYYARNIVLFLFGLVHLFVLLWPGDILHTYGLAALVVVLLRRVPASGLLAAGLVLATLELVGGGVYVGTTILQRGDEAALLARRTHGERLLPAETKRLASAARQRATRDRRHGDDAALAAAEDRARTGTPSSWARSAWASTIFIEKQFLEIAFVWEAASTMLIGAALFKLGIIQGRRSRRFYAATTVLAYALGLGCRIWAAYATTRFDHEPSFSLAFTEYARLATTIGHVGLVNLLLASGAGARLLRPFEAAGRTALSIYVGQTLICLWVLYPPWGFALYGRTGWATMMATALAVDIGLLLLANWYVRRFAIAPVEWAWRSLIVRRRLPFRRSPVGVPAVAERLA